KLNSSKITESDIAPEDYLAMAGYNRDRIVEKINRHLIDKFSGDAPKLKIELTTDDDILAYSFLNKRLQFKTKFESLRAPVRFESGGAFTSVEAFGITQYFRRKHRKMGRQVRVVDYLSDNDFIVTLKTIAKNDEIILAKISPKETLRKTVESVLDRLEKSKPESLKEEDILMIPLVDLKIDHSYEELIGLGIKNEGFQGGILGEALQTIDFHLNEEGALLKSQSIITVELNGDPYKKLVFDKAFLILLKQKKSKNPYLSIWIDNPALFREKKKEARSAFSDTTTFD
ncbi:MAG: hypothetical protein GY847_28155, partial [Proteobacteria bacterium]|nr:hypothetical protein [Pseudomonadota bacterium]